MIITARTLRALCRPVDVLPGEPLVDVARKLGCSVQSLNAATNAGALTVRYYKGLGGKRGKPIPVSDTSHTLDPNGPTFRERPHQAWGGAWARFPDRLPDDFEQTLTRTPIYHDRGTKVGQFHEWLWLCPACGERVRKLFLPFAPMRVTEHLQLDPITLCRLPRARCGRSEDRPVDDNAPIQTFACARCHGVQPDSADAKTFWNQVVTFYTGGLLFGREVPRPDWIVSTRKRNYQPKLNVTATVRERVLRCLMSGMDRRAIALKLGITYGAVTQHFLTLCRHERVASIPALVRKLTNGAVTSPLNQLQNARERRKTVQSLILEGHSHKQIARELKTKECNVCADARKLYKMHRVSNRRQLARKLGTLHPMDRTMAELRRRLINTDQPVRQMAFDLKLPVGTVYEYVRAIFREHGVTRRDQFADEEKRTKKTEAKGSGVFN